MPTANCPKCKQPITIDAPDPAGMTLLCPYANCGATIQIPPRKTAPSPPPPPPRYTSPPPPPPPPFEEVTDDETGAEDIYFEGALTPRVDLLKGETQLYRLSIGWREQLFGLSVMSIITDLITYFVLGYRSRIVMTTHRMFFFDKKILSNELFHVWLPEVASVGLRTGVSLGQLLLAAVLTLGGFVYLGIGFEMLIVLVFVALLILTAFRQQFMVILTSGTYFTFTFGRMTPREAEEFAAIFFRRRHALSINPADRT
jgi:hypothetical protein